MILKLRFGIDYHRINNREDEVYHIGAINNHVIPFAVKKGATGIHPMDFDWDEYFDENSGGYGGSPGDWVIINTDTAKATLHSQNTIITLNDEVVALIRECFLRDETHEALLDSDDAVVFLTEQERLAGRRLRQSHQGDLR